MNTTAASRTLRPLCACTLRTAAVLYQSVIVTASDPGVSLGGTHVDEDEVLAADFGQWGLAR